MPALIAEKGIKNVHIGNATRNAAGDQVITGLGFKPRIIVFFAKNATATYQIGSWGFTDGPTQHCTYALGNAANIYYDTTRCIHIYKDADNSIRGRIKTMDSDGFTLEWFITGTITARFIWMALR